MSMDAAFNLLFCSKRKKERKKESKEKFPTIDQIIT
jgi:hypothetical protein